MILMLLLVDYRFRGYNVVIEILLLESFWFFKCNALTSICYHYSSLPFEVVEVWCTNNTKTSVLNNVV